MIDDDSIDTQKSPDEVNEACAEHEVSRRSRVWLYCGMVGVLVSILAWGFLMFIPGLSLWLSVAGMVLSACGIRVGRCCWRDIAISSLIASSVLVLVHVIFNWALDYAISTL